MSIEIKNAKCLFKSDILDKLPIEGANMTVLCGTGTNATTLGSRQYLFMTANKPARAVIVVPIAHHLRRTPFSINSSSSESPDETAQESYDYICLPKQTQQVVFKFTNSAYQIGSGIVFENPNGTLTGKVDRDYVAGGSSAEVTFDIPTDNDKFVWLVMTLKKGSEGTEAITGLTIQELGFSLDVELRNGAIYHFGVANE